jgi:hypothetical protein
VERDREAWGASVDPTEGVRATGAAPESGVLVMAASSFPLTRHPSSRLICTRAQMPPAEAICVLLRLPAIFILEPMDHARCQPRGCGDARPGGQPPWQECAVFRRSRRRGSGEVHLVRHGDAARGRGTWVGSVGEQRPSEAMTGAGGWRRRRSAARAALAGQSRESDGCAGSAAVAAGTRKGGDREGREEG